jgi:hypothetical protein
VVIWDLDNQDKFDQINRMITLSVITLSEFMLFESFSIEIIPTSNDRLNLVVQQLLVKSKSFVWWLRPTSLKTCFEKPS